MLKSSAYSFDSLSSNSMKSSNPKSGCRKVDVARTVDTAYPDFYSHVSSGIKDFVKNHPYMTIFGAIAAALGAWKTFGVLRDWLSGDIGSFTPESGHARKGKEKV